jgi:hypothetical protein
MHLVFIPCNQLSESQANKNADTSGDKKYITFPEDHLVLEQQTDKRAEKNDEHDGKQASYRLDPIIERGPYQQEEAEKKHHQNSDHKDDKELDHIRFSSFNRWKALAASQAA